MREAADMRQMVCFELLMNFLHIVRRPTSAKNILSDADRFSGPARLRGHRGAGSFQLAAAHLNASQTALRHRIISLTFGSSSRPKTDVAPVSSRRRASP